MSDAWLRIALVGAFPFPSPQGSQVFVGQMARRLAAAGHEVHLVTYGQADGPEPVMPGVQRHRAPRIPGDDSRRSGPNPAKPLLDLLLLRTLLAVVRRHAIDVVHAHNYEAAIVALAARRATGTPVVYHSHNLMGDELETYYRSPSARRLAGRVGMMLDRQVPRRADRCIALCDWSAARLREAGCEAGRLHVLPPAVEDEEPLASTASDRAAFGLQPTDFVVGYVGNLDAYQNLPLLFEAMRGLVARCVDDGLPAPRLLLASHAAAPLLEAEAAAAGLGAHLVTASLDGADAARRALAVSDVAALPRRLGSGYPVKLLNAMRAAKPVVTAGCGGKVIRDGVDGLVVADDDPVAMASALERCRRDRARSAALGIEARRTFLGHMAWETVLPRIEAVYVGLREPSCALPVAGAAVPAGRPRTGEGGDKA